MTNLVLHKDHVNDQASLLYMKLNATPEMTPLEIRSLYEKAYRELSDADWDEKDKEAESIP